MGSDMHHTDDYLIEKARKKVKRLVKDDQKVEDLFCNNFDKVIRDEEFNINR